jgi:glycosyltransferase involved in cell wall biosynthesis
MTRHWSGQENTWEDILKPTSLPPQTTTHENYDVLFLPSKRYKLNDLLSSSKLLRLLFGNIYFFILGCMGRFNTEVDVYLAFRKQFENHLKSNEYDAVIISSPPSNILELISVVKKYSKAVVVADIRDLWNNLMLTVGYKPSIKQFIWDFFYARYYKIWLKDVDLITVIIKQFSEVLKEFTKAPIEVVYNGYESTLFGKMRKNPSDKFVFSVVGNIYPEQDLSVLLEGLNLFISGKSSDDFCIRFVGAKSLPLVSDKISAALPAKFLYISDRVTKEEALQETLDADVLSYCGWKGVKGMISTKAFDYIASGNYVLIAPGDGDVLDDLISECKCGSSVNSPQEFAQRLDSLYLEWKKNGKLKVESNREKIEFYSREHQAERMAKLILELIEKRNQE